MPCKDIKGLLLLRSVGWMSLQGRGTVMSCVGPSCSGEARGAGGGTTRAGGLGSQEHVWLSPLQPIHRGHQACWLLPISVAPDLLPLQRWPTGGAGAKASKGGQEGRLCRLSVPAPSSDTRRLEMLWASV